jgi:Sulfatase
LRPDGRAATDGGRVGRWISHHPRSLSLFERLAAVPFYPAILTFVYIANAVTFMVVPLGSLRRPSLVGIVIASALVIVLGLLLRNRDRAAFAATALIVIPVSSTQPWLIPALGVAVAVAATAIESRYGRIPWRTVTGVGNVIAVAMLVVVVGRGLTSDELGALMSDLGIRVSQRSHGTADATTPDIYLLLLDGHPRTDTLQEVWGVDGGEFVAGLRQRGFRVAPKSHSNYTFTIGTLASSFQMRALHEITQRDDAAPGLVTGRLMRDAITDGPVLAELRQRGYEIVAVDSGYNGVDIRSADRRFDTGAVTEFEIALIRLLGLPVVVDNVAPTWLASSIADRIDDNLALVPVIASEPRSQDRPRFVFVHIPSPHAPAVFRADGSVAPISVERLFDWDRDSDRAALRDAFAAHLAVLDHKVMDTIDALDAEPSDRQRVVIVFSDHGSRLDQVSEEGLSEHAANLVASRFPDGSDPFGDRPATINLFPVLLDHLFDAGLPLQPDRIFVSVFDAPTWTELQVPP